MDSYNYRKALENIAPFTLGKTASQIMAEYNLDTITHLNANENPYGSSSRVKEAVLETMNTPSLYPDSYSGELRRKVSKKYKVDMDEIIFGSGTDEVIYFLGKSYIEPGDEIITGEITFRSYDTTALCMGGNAVLVPMNNHGFCLDEMIKAITPKTKMIFLANPNNPTGTIITDQEQREFMEKVPPHILVVIDEAYSDFCLDSDFPNSFEMRKQFKNLVMLKTFSKAYGLASFRIGYGIADEEIIEILNRVRNTFNTSVHAQAAGCAAIKDTEFVNACIKKNNEVVQYLYSALDELDLPYIRTHASFIMFDSKANSLEVTNALLKKGYMVRAGVTFFKDMDTYLRVSIGTMEQMEGFITALKEILGL